MWCRLMTRTTSSPELGDNAELVVIDGADHVFSEHAQVMVEKVVGWLQGQWA